MKEILRIAPSEIEKKSFEIITEELGDRQPDQDKAPIVKRVIHTTADFDYADNLFLSVGRPHNVKVYVKGMEKNILAKKRKMNIPLDSLD